MSNTQITVQCSYGFTLAVKGSNLIVTKKRSEESYPIDKIQSITLSEPKGLTLGTITFCTAQAASAGLNIGLGISVAAGAEKSYCFPKSELEAAKALRDYVVNFDETKNTQLSEGMVVSVVDEIRGLKRLLDDGILTQEEFDAKKKQLLGI